MNYQEISIEGIPLIRGIDRSSEYEAIFKEVSVKNKTILDIGCHFGYYLLKAISEGAAYGVGIEKNKGWSDTAKRVSIYGSTNIVNADAFNIDYSLYPSDILLCLNLFHHFRTIQQVEILLDKVEPYIDETMIFVTLPTSKINLYGHEETRPGIKKLHISPEYFRLKYSDWNLKVLPTTVKPLNRKIVILERKKENEEACYL